MKSSVSPLFRQLPIVILTLGLSGATALNFLSPQKEAQMGIDAFEKIKKEKKIVSSGSKAAMTKRVGSRLVQNVDVPHAKWEFVLFDDKTPNAFALPGGKVGVHTGLFKIVENEAQLAAVLGHELGHVTARHSGKRMSQGILGAGVGGLAGVLLSKKTDMDMKTAQGITQGAAMLNLLRYSRKQELESDRLGAMYMAQSGYDPQESVTLWQQFSAYKDKHSKGAPPAFLSTHPVDSRRIEELQAFMPQAQRYYNPNAPSVGSTAIPVSKKPKKAIRYTGS